MVLRRAVNLLTLSTSLTVELSSLSSLWDFTRLERWSTSPHILGHVLLHSTHLPSCPVASPEPCPNRRAVIMQVMQSDCVTWIASVPNSQSATSVNSFHPTRVGRRAHRQTTACSGPTVRKSTHCLLSDVLSLVLAKSSSLEEVVGTSDACEALLPCRASSVLQRRAFGLRLC